MRTKSQEMENSLLCEEKLLFTSPSQTCCYRERFLDVPNSWFYYTTREERDKALEVCLNKENYYLLGASYVDHLQSSDLVDARLRAIGWIIKTHYRLNFSLGVVFEAVNFLDRFISLNRSKKWKYWMIELLSVACLSIAAKSNEVFIPPLIEFQMEDLDHSFHPCMIQRMELTLMMALGWRLSCVTPYSYVDLLTWHLDSLLPQPLHVALTARMKELLLSALSDPKFSEFRPCTVAVSAFRCSVEELLPSRSNTHLFDLGNLFPFEYMPRYSYGFGTT
ncbi:putative cyclin-D7-1 isoform X2 [Tasmannia lanceolata]|uniref:putative cyclin-D7-1 isoform X2 n=1 Tax=Tasmannia lanceolata TaxID=3420 RepID=UPI0040634339